MNRVPSWKKAFSNSSHLFPLLNVRDKVLLQEEETFQYLVYIQVLSIQQLKINIKYFKVFTIQTYIFSFWELILKKSAKILEKFVIHFYFSKVFLKNILYSVKSCILLKGLRKAKSLRRTLKGHRVTELTSFHVKEGLFYYFAFSLMSEINVVSHIFTQASLYYSVTCKTR